ncbi:hypothetical protein N431DRAFT_468786 [Stipitochalara longipes BDJ]|nr:hypothetical protein N431DRAFT_468786 [Stipitochalara longipes BDJ]
MSRSASFGGSSERKGSYGEAGRGLGSAMVNISRERKIGQGEASLDLGLLDDSKQSKVIRKGSMAVRVGKVKEMVKKFNGAAIQEETANENDVNTTKMKRVFSQEHTSKMNDDFGKQGQEMVKDIDEMNHQGGMAPTINELPNQDEDHSNVEDLHLDAWRIKESLGSKDEDAESVQSIIDSNFDEILDCYDMTQSTIPKEALDNKYVAIPLNSLFNQAKLATDFTENKEDNSVPSTPADDESNSKFVSPILKLFASKCVPPEHISKKSTNTITDLGESPDQESTFEPCITTLERQYSHSNRIFPRSEAAADSFQTDVQIRDVSVLAREYSDLISSITSLDDPIDNEDIDPSARSSSSASLGLQLSQHLTPYHNFPHLDSPSTSPLLRYSPNETTPSHSYSLSNASSIYSTDGIPTSYYGRHNSTTSNASSPYENDKSCNDFPPLRHHGRHQITDLITHSPNPALESSRFSFAAGFDSISRPSYPTPPNQSTNHHLVRPPSSTSQISASNTLVSTTSSATLLNSPSLEDGFIYDSESGQMAIRGGQSLTGEWVAIDGTVWNWDGTRWVGRGRNLDGLS